MSRHLLPQQGKPGGKACSKSTGKLKIVPEERDHSERGWEMGISLPTSRDSREDSEVAHPLRFPLEEW